MRKTKLDPDLVDITWYNKLQLELFWVLERTEGSKIYSRTLLKELVDEFLPNGIVLWAAVAAEYKRRSGKKEDWDPCDMENIGN